MQFLFSSFANVRISRLCMRIGVYAGLCIAMSGCGDFLAKKSTEIESKAVIRDIARVRENPHIYNAPPEMYRSAPQRLALGDGVRMFYFTKHHPAKDIADELKKLGFKVSQNSSTNQVVIHAADEDECDIIEEYLLRTDVPPIQVHIDCIILERFGDVTKDWETTILIENLFGEQITLGEGKYPGAAFPGAALREARRSEFGLDFGFWKNEGIPGHQVRVIVDILESRGYLKILMNPTLETVNGKAATVQIRDRAPIEKVVTNKNQTYSVVDYQWVTDTVTVTPFVYADGSVGLKTSIVMGSQSKPEGVVQKPIITERSIDVAENRIEPGMSLIIGGMRKSENRSVVRGVPFFKDLPLIGVLFSSKDFEENANETVFILTPSISSGGVHYTEMAEMIREKYRTPDQDTLLDDLVADPLAGDVYTQYVEQKGDQARADTVRFQREAQRADFEAQEARLRAERIMLEMQAMRVRGEQAVAQTKADQARAQAAAKEAQAQQALISQTQEDIEKAQAEAAAARAEAQAAQDELDVARQKTQAIEQEAQTIKAQQDALEAELQNLRQIEEPQDTPPASVEQ
ncbi:MAG: hypothetical protein GXY41_12590 [Phycisphaerae bacterium]|nr:hypothetical protein [Phycisphaerae bacterium]